MAKLNSRPIAELHLLSAAPFSLEMTATRTLLYVRTPQGRAVAFSPDATLSPKLKTLLKAVDGKVSVSELLLQFADADAAESLGQLELAGLIKLREDRVGDFQKMPAMALIGQSVPPIEAFIATAAAPLQPTGVAANQLDELSPEPSTGLARIVDVMSTFVLTHFPQQAFTVLAKLEGFKSLNELEAGLPDYAVLAKASGPVGVVHLAEVTERVREAAAA